MSEEPTLNSSDTTHGAFRCHRTSIGHAYRNAEEWQWPHNQDFVVERFIFVMHNGQLCDLFLSIYVEYKLFCLLLASSFEPGVVS